MVEYGGRSIEAHSHRWENSINIMEAVKGEELARNYIVDKEYNLIRIFPIEKNCVFLDEEGKPILLWQLKGKSLVPFGGPEGTVGNRQS